MMIRVFLVALLSASTAAGFVAEREHVPTSLIEGQRRRTQDSCRQATLDLYNSNPPLQEAYRTALAARDAALDACGNAPHCEIDDANYPSTPAYVAACETAGGLIYEFDMKITCVRTDGIRLSDTSTSMQNIDHCYDPSCDVETIVAEAEQEANADLDVLETSLTGNGVVTVCDADYSVNDALGNDVSSNRLDGDEDQGDASGQGSSGSLLAAQSVAMTAIMAVVTGAFTLM